MVKGFVGTRGDRGIMVKEHTLWTKIEIAVLAFFAKNDNASSTYREIARAYVSSSYSNYQKACNSLFERGWLIRLEDGSFRVHSGSWGQIKKGTETVERSLPYFDVYLRKVRKLRKHRIHIN